jgi:hypothetical protein
VGIRKAVEKILQLNEFLPLKLDLSEVPRHNVSHSRVSTQCLIHLTFGVFRATAALLPDGARTGWGKTVRVP